MKSSMLLSCFFTFAVTMTSLAAAPAAPTYTGLLGSGESSDRTTRFMLLTSEDSLPKEKAALATASKGSPAKGAPTANEQNSAILNRIISVRVQVQPLTPAQASSSSSEAPEVKVLAFDARMPAHAHGMLVKPSLPQKVAANLWQVDGVKLHMSGHWVVSLTTEVGGKNEKVDINVNVGAFPSEAGQTKGSSASK